MAHGNKAFLANEHGGVVGIGVNQVDLVGGDGGTLLGKTAEHFKVAIDVELALQPGVENMPAGQFFRAEIGADGQGELHAVSFAFMST